jgi:phosphoribosylformylglycinamidine synthase subunit PurQ / glutaminase
MGKERKRMTRKARVVVLRTAGTNCDQETAFAFHDCGASVSVVHVNKFFAKKENLAQYHILAIPGGFSYGDDIAAGKILANELRLKLGKELSQFVDEGKLIVGICNGFQVLVKAGLLPGFSRKTARTSSQQATLMTNDSGKFEDRWTHLKVGGRCVWTRGMEGLVYFPVAHGEGKFVCKDSALLKRLQDHQQVVFRYCLPDGRPAVYPDNPNGSAQDIAGITDPTGRILGLMPHPERHFLFTQHPYWTRLKPVKRYGDGAKIFQNAIQYVEETLIKKGK